jgi:hypothetical protein
LKRKKKGEGRKKRDNQADREQESKAPKNRPLLVLKIVKMAMEMADPGIK